ALLQDLACVEKEKHRVGAGDVAVRDVRALEREIVHAWGVDEKDALFEKRRGVADLEVVDVVAPEASAHRETSRVLEPDPFALARLEDDGGFRLLRIFEMVDGGGRRGHADGKDAFTEERVHERALAVIELADDDEVEAIFVELFHQLALEALFQASCAQALGD